MRFPFNDLRFPCRVRNCMNKTQLTTVVSASISSRWPTIFSVTIINHAHYIIKYSIELIKIIDHDDVVRSDYVEFLWGYVWGDANDNSP